MEMDANTFASWGVDYLKLDGCNSNVDQYADGMYCTLCLRLLYSCQREHLLATTTAHTQPAKLKQVEDILVFFASQGIILPWPST